MFLDSLKAIIEFLNENNGAFLVIFSFIVAVATIYYVKETKKLREAQTEPKVFITFQPRERRYIVDMIIQNVGLGPAYEINFEINPDFEYLKGKSFSDISIMKRGINQLGPNQKYEFFLVDLQKKLWKPDLKYFEVKVTYKNSVGKTYEDLYPIDLSQLDDYSLIGTDSPFYDIASDLNFIAEEISFLSTYIDGLDKTHASLKEDLHKDLRQLIDAIEKLK